MPNQLQRIGAINRNICKTRNSLPTLDTMRPVEVSPASSSAVISKAITWSEAGERQEDIGAVAVGNGRDITYSKSSVPSIRRTSTKRSKFKF